MLLVVKEAIGLVSSGSRVYPDFITMYVPALRNFNVEVPEIVLQISKLLYSLHTFLFNTEMHSY